MRLLSADYNQVELRVLAHVAGEDVLREIFASGEDVHAATAAEVLGVRPDEVGPAERSKAKMVNYGIAYGLSAFGLADRLQISREEAAAYIERYFERFPAVKRVHRRDDRRAPSATASSTRCWAGAAAIPELRSGQRQRRSLGRAAGGQHGDPGHRRGHHQGRDGALPRARSPRRASRPGWCSRSTTSSCSRGRRRRWTPAAELVRARDVRRLRARPAAGGRRRRRRGLAGREVEGAQDRGAVLRRRH